jgi:hypothetical protein
MQWSAATGWSKLWIETEIYLLIKRRVMKHIEQEKQDKYLEVLIRVQQSEY